jgi:hypothetical protein
MGAFIVFSTHGLNEKALSGATTNPNVGCPYSIGGQSMGPPNSCSDIAAAMIPPEFAALSLLRVLIADKDSDTWNDK